MTSYQRLKQQNSDLKNQIRILVEKPDSLDAAAIRSDVRLEISLEKLFRIKDNVIADRISQITDSSGNPNYPSL